jgi:hypothetical protein
MFKQAGDENDSPIENRLEQYRPDRRRAIVATNKSRGGGDQYRFADNERRAP